MQQDSDTTLSLFLCIVQEILRKSAHVYTL